MDYYEKSLVKFEGQDQEEKPLDPKFDRENAQKNGIEFKNANGLVKSLLKAFTNLRFDADQDSTREFRRVSLRDIVEIIFRRKEFIISFFGVTVLIFIVGTLFTRPLYQASSLISLDMTEKAILAPEFAPTQRLEWIETEARLIKSMPVLSKTVELLDLDSKDLGKYRSIFGFIFKLFAGSNKSKENSLEMTSSKQGAIGYLEKNVNVTAQSKTNLIEVEAEVNDPKLAADIVTTLTGVYIDRHFNTQGGQLEKNNEFINGQIELAKKELDEAEKSLQAFIKKENIASVEDELKINTQQLTTLQAEYFQTRTRKDEIRSNINNNQFDYEKMVSLMPQIEDDVYLTGLKQRLAVQESELATLSIRYTPTGELVTRAQQEVQALRNKIRQEAARLVFSTVAFLETKERSLVSTINEYEKKIQKLSENGARLNNLKQDVEHKRDIYSLLVKKSDDLRIQDAMKKDKISNIKNIEVVSHAQTPFSPSKPDWKINLLLALVIGSVGGIGGALFIDYMDDSVKDASSIQRYTKTEVLGSIPYLDNNSLSTSELYVHNSFKELWLSLSLKIKKMPTSSILITSLYSEGKTTAAINLAFIAAMLNKGKNVVLVDANLRHPCIHSMLSLRNNQGLMDILANGTTLNRCLQKTRLSNLKVLPSGNSLVEEPLALFDSDKFNDLLRELNSQFDFIIFDSPSLNRYSDSAMLSGKLAATLMLVELNKTRLDAARYGISVLSKANANILGVILNKRQFFIPAGIYKKLYGVN